VHVLGQGEPEWVADFMRAAENVKYKFGVLASPTTSAPPGSSAQYPSGVRTGWPGSAWP
jgi:hypothetical protein